MKNSQDQLVGALHYAHNTSHTHARMHARTHTHTRVHTSTLIQVTSDSSLNLFPTVSDARQTSCLLLQNLSYLSTMIKITKQNYSD